MRHTIPLLALFLILGQQVPTPKNYTPIPAANRNCRPSAACIQRCEKDGGQDCFQRCDPCR
jgi:hypothetical protein